MIIGELSSGVQPLSSVGVDKPAAGEQDVCTFIVRFLMVRGVRRVFGLCGGHVQPLWDCAARRGIHIVDVRHEAAAVHMAQAQSELTNELSAVFITAGPGVTNAITGIANAYISRIPLLVVAGKPPRPQENMGALQDLPQVEMVRSITRYARTVRCVRHVAKELDEAWARAWGQGGEPGPVFLEFPTDLLRETIPAGYAAEDRLPTRDVFPATPSQAAIERVADMLWQAGRPVLISGRGARAAKQALTALIDRLNCVYLDTAESRGMIAEDHPAYMPAVRSRAMQEADLVVTIGRQLDFQLGYGSPAIFPHARFIRIGSSPAELRSNRRGDLEVGGAVDIVLKMLLASTEGRRPGVEETWVNGLRQQDRERRRNLILELQHAPPGGDGRMHPYRLFGHVRDRLAADAIVVADGGDCLSFARMVLMGSDYLDPGGLGCLGVGVPYGIAAALAFPDRQVVVLTGDGAFGLNGMELDTAKRHGARMVVVVANNSAWNIERTDQDLNYGGRIVGTELPDCDYAAFARALGVYAERVTTSAELAGALKRAAKHAPALVDVMVTRDALSPDARSGLAMVPDHQPLTTWDQMEKAFAGHKKCPEGP
jgi:acetolactate synthase-1/2/3 large subunit